LLGRTSRPSPTAKLHRAEVDAIRRWARGAGFGLSVGDQVRVLRTDPSYAALAPETLRALLLNHSWPDLTYDRTSPLSVLPLSVLTARAVAVMPWSQRAGNPAVLEDA
jgi:hypothetical protein